MNSIILRHLIVVASAAGLISGVGVAACPERCLDMLYFEGPYSFFTVDRVCPMVLESQNGVAGGVGAVPSQYARANAYRICEPVNSFAQAGGPAIPIEAWKPFLCLETCDDS